MKKIIFTICAALLLAVAFESCKKPDTDFTPIVVPGVKDTLVGYWSIVSLDAKGTIGGTLPATGKNTSEPEGFYHLREDSTYDYDIKAELKLKALGISMDYDYNDRDAGRWEVAQDEKSVIFKGNQGLDQRLYFTKYDSANSTYMEVAVPIDTTLKGFKYEGTILINMRKDK